MVEIENCNLAAEALEAHRMKRIKYNPAALYPVILIAVSCWPVIYYFWYYFLRNYGCMPSR